MICSSTLHFISDRTELESKDITELLRHAARMDGFEIDTVLLLFLFGLVLNSSYTASCSFGNGNRISVSSCTMIHEDEGSVPSVIASDECLSLLQWPISTTASLRNRTIECQFAQLKGRRKYQEDRITCDLDMNMPSLGYFSLTFLFDYV